MSSLMKDMLTRYANRFLKMSNILYFTVETLIDLIKFPLIP